MQIHQSAFAIAIAIAPFLTFTSGCEQQCSKRDVAGEASATSPPPAVGDLPGRIAAAPEGVKGFDSWEKPDTNQLADIAAAGYGFAVRYVMLTDNEHNLTRGEAEAILAAGLALMIVQEGAEWQNRAPSAALGQEYGLAALDSAKQVGYPTGAVVWLDVEAVATGTADDVIAYVTAWHDAVSGHYRTGLYVGPDLVLSEAQLAGLPFDHFWMSGVTRLSVPGHPYQLTQHPPETIADVKIDVDRTATDERGGVPWLQPRGWTAPSPVR